MFSCKFLRYCFERILPITFFYKNPSLYFDLRYCSWRRSYYYLNRFSLASSCWASASNICLLFSYSIFYFYFSCISDSSWSYILLVSKTFAKRAYITVKILPRWVELHSRNWKVQDHFRLLEYFDRLQFSVPLGQIAFKLADLETNQFGIISHTVLAYHEVFKQMVQSE